MSTEARAVVFWAAIAIASLLLWVSNADAAHWQHRNLASGHHTLTLRSALPHDTITVKLFVNGKQVKYRAVQECSATVNQPGIRALFLGCRGTTFTVEYRLSPHARGVIGWL